MKGMEFLSEQKEAVNPKEAKIFSLEEVSFHADQNSCWIVIKDGVYDVTDFVGEHPGGREIMLEHAGLDATTVFQDIGHSAEALKILAKYYIGELREEDRIYDRKPKH
ncbi:unnamed protein product [Porites evermanni]|uniref:Cytochrome b5 heme-binding domain-containing protein n=1 Tax=Porites evermanni TaxID=104178 RepID=A0ABN8LY58_9CNID|nr:unnamed protein product [Porites evermanni]